MFSVSDGNPRVQRVRVLAWSRKVTLLLLVLLLFAVIPAALERPYRDWIFRRADRIQVVVYCDTSVFRAPVRAIAMYDDLALKIVPRALGMFQNRPADRVRTFHSRNVRVGKVGDYYVELEDVPNGPLVRIMLLDGESKFYIEVPERKIFRGQMSVWAQP